MSSKMSIIAPLVHRWLARYVPPTHLRSDSQAREAEIDALLRAVLRYTPSTGIDIWWDRLTTRIDAEAQTSAWPRVATITAHCQAMLREDHAASAPEERQGFAVDTFAVNAARINAGEAVGDHWLWGRNAIRIVRRGLVAESRIVQFREAFAARLRDFYGDEIAETIIATRNADHQAALHVEDAALAQWRAGRTAGARIPDKRTPAAKPQAERTADGRMLELGA